ncbi:MAG TPA: right-handed parallel beta-helix repeat-containing protein [Acidimicrobiia bacterium]
MPKLVRWGGALLFAVALAACGDDSATEVVMLDNSFSPAVVEVGVGDTVRFVNRGRVQHDAQDVDGAWKTDLLDPEGSQEITFTEEGTYEFFCSLHSTENEEGERQGMVGTVVVGDPEDDAPESAGPTDEETEFTGTTRDVPADYPTIQSAVDAAEPGDLILIQPGTYKEAVSVTTPRLVIRGADRNRVILDGEYTRENAFVVTADGVAIENMTAVGYTSNNFFWTGVTGYRGSYLTSIDGWVYGIYAFDSTDGLFEHSYASGSYDAGFYIGQCDPCNAMVTDVLAEFNGLGYSGTNSSGNIYIVNSEWRYNVAGIVPNTLDSEALPPVRQVTIAGNYAHHNGEKERAPTGALEWASYGNGIVLAGARDSLVHDNLLVNNANAGIQVVSMLDKNLWPSGGNVIRDNVVMGSGRADLMLGGPVEQGSCFEGNDYSTTLPWSLEFFHSCDGIKLPLLAGMAVSHDPLGRLAQAHHGQTPMLEHGDAPKPALDFPQMPGGADAPVRPAVDVFAGLDVTGFDTPELPDDVEIAERRPVILGVGVDGGFWPVWFGAILWWVPLAVYVLVGAWALWNLWRSDRGLVGRIVWTVVILLLPFFGALAYVLAGNPNARPGRRLLVGLGGLGVWLAVVVASLLVGGIL